MKITSLLLTICTLLSLEANAKTVELLGDSNYSPYIYKDGNVAKGAYKDILSEASNLMQDFDIKFTLVPWKRGLSLVKEGAYIGIFPPYKHASRDYMEYSTPLYKEKVVVICNSEKVKAIPKNYPYGYKGLTFGNNLGFKSPGDEFFNEVKKGNIILDEVKTTESNLKKLATKRIDCYVNDSLVISKEINSIITKNQALKNAFNKVKEYAIVKKEAAYVGYTKKNNFPYKNKFKAALNDALQKMSKSGRIDAIIKKYSK